MITEEKLTIEEEIAQKEFSPEYSKYSYSNEISTLNNYLFNSNGIKESLLNLISIKNSGRQEVFMNELSNEPSLWKPKIKEEDYKELEKRLQEEITVYFHNLEFEFSKNIPGRWFNLMQKEFIPKLEGFTAGKKIDYWYGDGASKNKLLHEFKESQDFYQMSVRLFDDAINAFSCFVGRSIDISAWNHDKHQTYPRYGHKNFGFWKGTINNFLESTSILEEAIREINPYRPNPYQIAKGEVKLFHKNLGLIAMRGKPKRYLIENFQYQFFTEPREVTAPATLIISNKALERLEGRIKTKHPI